MQTQQQNNYKRITEQQHTQIFELRNSEEKLTWLDIEKLVGVSAGHCRKIFVNNTPLAICNSPKDYSKSIGLALINVQDLDFSQNKNPEFFCIDKWGKIICN